MQDRIRLHPDSKFQSRDSTRVKSQSQIEEAVSALQKRVAHIQNLATETARRRVPQTDSTPGTEYWLP